MRDFHLHTPTRLFFGSRSLTKAGRICKSHGHDRLLLVTGRNSCRLHGGFEALTRSLDKHNVCWQKLQGVSPNPAVSQAQDICDAARDFQAKALFALGGGSVIDAAKAAAAALGCNAPVREVLLAGRDVHDAAPLYAASTLAGSGSECNCEAVILDPESKSMQGLRGPGLFPRAAFVNPELQCGLPWEATRRGAVDAFCHVMERYIQAGAERLSATLAEGLMAGILEAAAELHRDGSLSEPRTELCWAAILAQNGALLAGIGPGDWTVHVFAHSLTARAPWLAHGDVVTALLPSWLGLKRRDLPDLLERWAVNVMRCRSSAEGVGRLQELFAGWGAPVGLGFLGLEASLIRQAADKALQTSARHAGSARAAAMQGQLEQLLEAASGGAVRKP